MINLIPPKAKKRAGKEYWARVLGVWAILLAIVAGVTALLLLPTYVLVNSQLSALQEEVVQQESAGEEFREAEEYVREANTTAAQLIQPRVAITAHEIIEEIVRVAPALVSPEVFRVSREEQQIDSIHVQGVADSREALSSFKNALERSPLFVSAAVPISDLARETDLPFAITIELAPAQNE